MENAQIDKKHLLLGAFFFIILIKSLRICNFFRIFAADLG